MNRRVVIEPELLWSMYWGNEYSTNVIASIFDCSARIIQYKMKKFDVPLRGLTDFKFNSRQYQIFEGCMLGDGNLEWMTNNCRFRNGDIHKEYLIWLQKQLGVEEISKIEYLDSWVYHLRTRVICSIRDEYKRWYPDGSGTTGNKHYKVIPKDIELTLITVLFWYLGDGSYMEMCGVARFTNYLTLRDAELLKDKLCILFNVDNGVTINKGYKNSKGKQTYIIRLNKVVTDKFFDLVDSLSFDIPECYQYKFGR